MGLPCWLTLTYKRRFCGDGLDEIQLIGYSFVNCPYLKEELYPNGQNGPNDQNFLIEMLEQIYRQISDRTSECNIPSNYICTNNDPNEPCKSISTPGYGYNYGVFAKCFEIVTNQSVVASSGCNMSYIVPCTLEGCCKISRTACYDNSIGKWRFCETWITDSFLNPCSIGSFSVGTPCGDCQGAITSRTGCIPFCQYNGNGN